MASIDSIVAAMRRAPNNIKFADACKVAKHYFGAPRSESTSHVVYKMPWQGDPRVNLQNAKGKAKDYQVRQLLKAIDQKLKDKDEEDK